MQFEGHYRQCCVNHDQPNHLNQRAATDPAATGLGQQEARDGADDDDHGGKD